MVASVVFYIVIFLCDALISLSPTVENHSGLVGNLHSKQNARRKDMQIRPWSRNSLEKKEKLRKRQQRRGREESRRNVGRKKTEVLKNCDRDSSNE